MDQNKLQLYKRNKNKQTKNKRADKRKVNCTILLNTQKIHFLKGLPDAGLLVQAVFLNVALISKELGMFPDTRWGCRSFLLLPKEKEALAFLRMRGTWVSWAKHRQTLSEIAGDDSACYAFLLKLSEYYQSQRWWFTYLPHCVPLLHAPLQHFISILKKEHPNQYKKTGQTI